MMLRPEGNLTLLSERELIARCMNGDLEAFGRLFERYEPSIFRYAYHMTGNADEADDIKQDTFVKAYRALSGFRGECTLLSWLLKVAGNLSRDHLRKRARRKEVPIMPGGELEYAATNTVNYDPALTLEREDFAITLHCALQSLPKHHRELIVLRELEGLSYQQMAEVLGCSVASIKLRLYRARRHFREQVKSLLAC
jgi:RNA polymerase sigma-70 factor (ECF subfamily)